MCYTFIKGGSDFYSNLKFLNEIRREPYYVGNEPNQ